MVETTIQPDRFRATCQVLLILPHCPDFSSGRLFDFASRYKKIN